MVECSLVSVPTDSYAAKENWGILPLFQHTLVEHLGAQPVGVTSGSCPFHKRNMAAHAGGARLNDVLSDNLPNFTTLGGI